MTEQEKLYVMAIWMIKNLCIDTNADQATYTVNGFRNNITGEQYGDYEIVIKKKDSTSEQDLSQVNEEEDKV